MGQNFGQQRGSEPVTRIVYTLGERSAGALIMKLSVVIYQDEDGTYIAECPAIPGCFSQGASQTEAEANIAMFARKSRRPG